MLSFFSYFPLEFKQISVVTRGSGRRKFQKGDPAERAGVLIDIADSARNVLSGSNLPQFAHKMKKGKRLTKGRRRVERRDHGTGIIRP